MGDNYRLPEVDADEVNVRDLNNVEYAAQHSGPDLSAKVANAVSALAGSQGAVVITPKDDGTPWQWSSTWTFDPTNHNGIDLIAAGATQIECDVGGWAITVDAANALDQEKGKRFRLYGGDWFRQGSASPEGWFRGNNLNFAHISPHTVRNFHTGNGCTCVQLRNPDEWSEHNTVEGFYKNFDIGFDTVPPSQISGSGGSATDSFIHQTLRMDMRRAKDIGYRFRGRMMGTDVVKPTINLKADNVVGYRLDGNLKGMRIGPTRFFDSNDNFTGGIAFQTGPDYTAQSYTDAPTILADSSELSNISKIKDKNVGADLVPIADPEAMILSGAAKGEKSGSQQSIPSGSFTQVGIDGTRFERDGQVVLVDESNDKLVLRKPGTYSLEANFAWTDSLGDGTLHICRLKAGGNVQAVEKGMTGGDTDPAYSLTADVEVSNPNMDVVMEVRQDSGSSKHTKAARQVNLSARLDG